ncbi:glycosyltransferase family 4 protein [Pontibacter sp. JH31]|uniref:Glycosyltransferase family 4 protein n=1 Tax=Pontibacter aquaedesilientis TaxID=2766980 RepID=A0ABR7XHI3_9BACT|nr:glycosyltransferase family 4 protein [Pontibacter aquaedesilientis]MBD1397716.1 glycosyltransferase family 4 protein [Pontibacter aquaedesilientis]
MLNKNKIRVLFFIGSLRSGGKERRLVELLTYLSNSGRYEIFVVLTLSEIHYNQFLNLNIPYKIIQKRWRKYDITVIPEFYRITKKFRPDLIHTWGRNQTFYALPSSIRLKIPIVNSQITSAPPKLNKLSVNSLIDRLNFRYSKIILSNSEAGIKAYTPPLEKSKVIYNGINLDRFSNLPNPTNIRAKYKIETPYAVVMVASISPNKDYRLFSEVARYVTSKRDDISFIGVGWYIRDDSEYNRLIELTKSNPKFIIPGNINDVEALVNACTIGVLFSNKTIHGEGISNAIMEYMALSKPVIANDAGGTREIVHNNKNGYLIDRITVPELGNIVIELVDDEVKRNSFGKASETIIQNSFTLEKMGKAFEKAYEEVLELKQFKQKKPTQLMEIY